jgi:hypothetical protein
MNAKVLVIAGVLACVLAIFFLFPVLTASNGKVDIRNEATEAVVAGEMTVCGKRFDLGVIRPQAIKHIDYRITCASNYILTVRFESGRTLTKDVGYVTSSWDFNDSVVIRRDDILLENSETK